MLVTNPNLGSCGRRQIFAMSAAGGRHVKLLRFVPFLQMQKISKEQNQRGSKDLTLKSCMMVPYMGSP